MNRRQLLSLMGIVPVILLGVKLGAKPQADPQIRSMTIRVNNGGWVYWGSAAPSEARMVSSYDPAMGTLTVHPAFANDTAYRVKPKLMKRTTWKLR